jgi:hypothetical protein
LPPAQLSMFALSCRVPCMLTQAQDDWFLRYTTEQNGVRYYQVTRTGGEMVYLSACFVHYIWLFHCFRKVKKTFLLVLLHVPYLVWSPHVLHCRAALHLMWVCHILRLLG